MVKWFQLPQYRRTADSIVLINENQTKHLNMLYNKIQELTSQSLKSSLEQNPVPPNLPNYFPLFLLGALTYKFRASILTHSNNTSSNGNPPAEFSKFLTNLKNLLEVQCYNSTLWYIYHAEYPNGIQPNQPDQTDNNGANSSSSSRGQAQPFSMPQPERSFTLQPDMLPSLVSLLRSPFIGQHHKMHILSLIERCSRKDQDFCAAAFANIRGLNIQEQEALPVKAKLASVQFILNELQANPNKYYPNKKQAGEQSEYKADLSSTVPTDTFSFYHLSQPISVDEFKKAYEQLTEGIHQQVKQLIEEHRKKLEDLYNEIASGTPQNQQTQPAQTDHASSSSSSQPPQSTQPRQQNQQAQPNRLNNSPGTDDFHLPNSSIESINKNTGNRNYENPLMSQPPTLLSPAGANTSLLSSPNFTTSYLPSLGAPGSSGAPGSYGTRELNSSKIRSPPQATTTPRGQSRGTSSNSNGSRPNSANNRNNGNSRHN